VNEAEIAPDPHLMESMRAVGYTLETAVADVIDNSITAQATTVDVLFAGSPQPFIAVLDNGIGMDLDGLCEAMRLAGRSPLQTRNAGDLGRFGLGLKTASLSQCRELTLVSKLDGELHGVRWSLDHLTATGRWALLVLGPTELADLPHVDRLAKGSSGTLVVWRDLDQLNALPGQLDRTLDEEMVRVRDHLALVFHRFTGTKKDSISIRVNGAVVPSTDPFLSDHRGTQHGPAESFEIDGQPVRVQPYTLPYVSKLSAAERTRAQVAGKLRDSQGFYIYRAGRLVIWGTWFRIVPKDDLGKLARVRVDIPNTLDHLWSLDIKKSTASPPPEVRKVLKRLAERIVRPSKATHLYRGRPVANDDPVHRLWNLVEERGTFRYEVNRAHPSLVMLSESASSESLTAIEQVLRALETSFPVEDAYNRLGGDIPLAAQDIDRSGLKDMARQIWLVHAAQGGTADDFAGRLSSAEPFSKLPNATDFLLKVTHD
jgi:hypothetical protein